MVSRDELKAMIGAAIDQAAGDPGDIRMSRAEVERLIDQAVARALRRDALMPIVSDAIEPLLADAIARAMIAVGVDTKAPIELQKDLAYLREWRRAMEEVRSKSIIAAATVMITGTLAMIALGIRHWLIGGGQ